MSRTFPVGSAARGGGPNRVRDAAGLLVLAALLAGAAAKPEQLLADSSSPLRSQSQEEAEIRVLAVVDYLSATEAYLSAGTEHGLRVGDTLAAYGGEDPSAPRLGFLVIQSATARRSVAAFAGEDFTLSRGQSIYLGLPESLAKERAEIGEGEPEPGARRPVQQDSTGFPGVSGGGERATAELRETGRPDESRPPSVQKPVQLRGRVSLDMDALQTTTRWGGEPSQGSRRTFSTPTFRLQARAQDLPGGIGWNTNMRLSHRTSSGDLVQPETSLRFYQFELEKSFAAIPLELHLGRFTNPFDDFGGYWDGFMAHLGQGGFGAGLALGYEPELWNEGLSTKRPKISGFVDYSARNGAADYEGALSFTALRPRSDLPYRRYVGFSQRIRLGNAWVGQRLQVDQSPGASEWTLTRLQLDTSIPLYQGLSAYGGWRRWRPYDPFLPSGDLAPRRDRANAGVSLWSATGGMSVDVSLDIPENGSQARTISSSFFLGRTPLLGLGFSGMASYWTRGELSSLILSPEVRRAFGPVQVRSAYRFYRTDLGSSEIRSQFADLTVTLPLGTGVSARIQGWVQWGQNLSSNRVQASLWKVF